MPVIRYPGAKTKKVFRAAILAALPARMDHYLEPFVGSGAVVLAAVAAQRFSPGSVIRLNDLDPGIVALWRCITGDLDPLIARVKHYLPTTADFFRFKTESIDGLPVDEQAFRRLALHQMSFGGLGAKAGGPIGGIEQTGKYKVDCRWNPTRRVAELQQAARLLQSFTVVVTNEDAVDIIARYPEAVVYADPPYVERGSALYLHDFAGEHERLAGVLRSRTAPWVLSYDDCALVRRLYAGFSLTHVKTAYSIHASDEDERPQPSEVLITSVPATAVEAAPLIESLKAKDRWVCWRNIDGKKIPCAPRLPLVEARVNDESSWGTYAEASALAAASHVTGIGYVLGDGEAGVDLDDCRDPQTGVLTPAAQAIVAALPTYAEISPSQTGIKLFLKTWLGKNHARKGLEIYGHGRYFTVTQQHLAGTPTDIQPLAKELEALIFAEFGHDEADDPEIADADLAIDVTPEDDDGELIDGSRNNALARLAGSLRRIGMDDDELVAALQVVNRKRCKPPLEPGEVARIAKSIGRYAPSKAEKMIEWMNGKHAVLRDSGKAIVITEEQDPLLNRRSLDRSDFADIRKWYCTRMVHLKKPGGKGNVVKPLGDYWLSHPARREYRKIIFDPEGQHPPDIYNLWSGFAVTPRQGSWSLLRDHLHGIIAGGRDDVFSYFLGWLARAVQKPGRPGEVALVMRGAQGAGKGILARSLGHIFGQHFVHVARAHHLTGHFNAHLQDAVLVFSDEAIWAGDKTAEGALKALITEPTLPIERKGRDAVIVKNVIHLILASNNEWAAPMGMDDRRFCVVDVLPDYVGQHAYFQKIRSQLQNGGFEAMLYDLLHLDLSQFDHRKPPATEASFHQKVLGMSSAYRWWYGKLKDGRVLPWHEGWSTDISRTELHHDYIKTVKTLGIAKRSSETELGYSLRELVPTITTTRKTVNVRIDEGPNGPIMAKRLERLWIMPTIEVCRDAFAKAAKTVINWDEHGVPTQAPLPETGY